MSTLAPPRPEESLRETLGRLSGAQKGAAGAPAYSRFVNRKLGRLLAAVAFHARLTPNAVTGISAVFTATALVLLATVEPSWTLGLVLTACLVLGYAFDAADGQLARLRGGGSPAGEWLDHMVDAVKSSGLHLALVIGLYRFDVVDPVVLLVPLGYCLVDAVTYFATMLNEALRAQHGVATRAQPTAQPAGIGRSLLTLPTDYGLLACLFVLYGAPGLFVPAYTLLFLAAAGFLALASIKWFTEMTRLPR
ncbi:CDP-alcohol phosphatidyltransferase family protein [Blastococcus sp. TML/M2B]|uniref:CDP-alcohol phosphatidyltransferase family protein n=1 Tax=unclassified Blastococcus TaxID=2619396 RepID=UPI00190D6394|nr:MULTISPECIES: CDP-alcohol phosphatidyltransferase family protein [unclassified Blastococcus]MBN1091553.1 CDP-alcohol phosphatidyltransferase family protein [Blastococcus sp. TML/M2B]MBN1094895.1 CDP-alcohol phosphatidyltransferase family protein [Blastococcus sp. TML/C7B]